MLKKSLITSVIIIFLAIAFVLADYFAVFGTKFETSFDMVEAIFKPIDKKTGQVVLDEIRVRCTQKGVEEACTQKPSKYLGQLRVNVPVVRLKEKTLFFTKDEGAIKSTDPDLNVMLMSQKYSIQINTFSYEELINSSEVKEYIIEME